MTRLSDISIRVEQATGTGHGASNAPAATGTIGGGVAAILNEVASLLERLATEDEPAAIDLRSLPMSPEDHARLADALGRGEVDVVLRADGESTIRETRFRGVWWTEHRDRSGELRAAYIEVAQVPTILVVEADELAAGAAALRRTASEVNAPPSPVEADSKGADAHA